MSTLVRMSGLALALTVTLATSGCVAAGLATGPLMSAVQLIGDRTVERTVAADLAEAQGATEAVLARMAFRVEGRERHEGVRSLRAVTDGVTVYAKLERVTATLTRIGLRVEVGRVTADRDTGTQMQEQIAALLAPPAAGSRANDPVSAEALATLQTEIQKLRSGIEARAAGERPASGAESGSTMRVEPGAVVTVPMSAALPTVDGPTPTVSVAIPAGAPAATVAEAGSSRPEPAETTLGASTSTPLHPAGALTPIQAATGVGSDQ